MQYTWKRDFYETLKDKVPSNMVTVLLGPYKCGKTTALLQLNEELSGSHYFDAEKMSAKEQEQLLARILFSIGNDEDITYIIDDISYIPNADCFIAKIAGAFDHLIACVLEPFSVAKTHILLSDNQAAALYHLTNRSFCGCAGYVYADFMGYDEWLSMKRETSPQGYEKSTESNYCEYVTTIGKFHDLPDIETYLRACLSYATLSVKHSSDLVYLNHNVEGLTEQILLEILLATLNDSDYSFLEGLSDELLVRALILLETCELIKIFGVGDSFNSEIFNCPLLCYSTEERKAKVYNRETLFRSIGLFVNHPMFALALAQKAFGEIDFGNIPERVFAAVIESHCRRLLPERGSFRFRAKGDSSSAAQELSYLSPNHWLAVDFCLSDERIDRFDTAAEYAAEDEDFWQNKCVKLSKQRSEERITAKGIKVNFVPYYEYLYRLSVQYDYLLL